ncbi:MAG: M48 family metalloprotease [Candidatus Paceibacterota bacterium]
MATLYTHQTENVAKTWVLITFFLTVVISLGWFFSYYYQSSEILYFAVIFSIFANIFSYWFSDKITLSVAGAKPVTREEYFDLYNAVENLSITAGLPMPKIYVIPDNAPNAFATGRNKTHATVAVTTGLLQIMNKTELEGVIAHELSHIGNRDILLSTMVVVLVGTVTLLSNMFMRSMWLGGRRNDDRGSGNILAIIGIALAILTPIIATLIQLAISRKREFLADSSGALLTRYPEGLASALKKIGAYNAPMLKANTATAHLYISNPFGPNEKKVSAIAKLFLTHPPLQERIKALENN